MKKKEIDIWSSKKVCDFFEITRTTLSNWRKAGCPGGREGYDIFKVFRWYCRNIMTTPERERSLAEEKLAYSKARTRLKELELLQVEGSLIEKEVPKRWLHGHVTIARDAFLSLPRRLAESIAVENDPKSIEVILREEIRRILEDLAAPLKKK